MSAPWRSVDWDQFWFGGPEFADVLPRLSNVVPFVLDALAGDQPGQWVSALDWLTWNFTGITEAHPLFVSFLVEILQRPETRCRGRILDMLGCLAQSERLIIPKDEARDVLAETRAALWSGADVIITLLSDPQISVRTSAPYAIAMLLYSANRGSPDDAQRITDVLLRRLDLETKSLPKASVVVALGLFARQTPALVTRLRTLFHETDDPPVRMAAALALAGPDPDLPTEALDLLLAEVRERANDERMSRYFARQGNEMELRHNPLAQWYGDDRAAKTPGEDKGAQESVLFPWTDSEDPITSAVLALCAVSFERYSQALPALTEAVAACNYTYTSSVHDPILRAVFAGQVLPEDWRREDLSEAQFAVLAAVYHNEELWDKTYCLCDTVSDIGLSRERSDWRERLEL
jgi:hypothetical protein